MNYYESPQTVDQVESVAPKIPREHPPIVSRNFIVVLIVAIQLARAVANLFSN